MKAYRPLLVTLAVCLLLWLCTTCAAIKVCESGDGHMVPNIGSRNGMTCERTEK